jgi:hypothetical protein
VHGEEDCKTEETTYLFPCTGTPSHAGTAGELTLHVANRHSRLTWCFLTPWRLVDCRRVENMYMYMYILIPWASAYSFIKRQHSNIAVWVVARLENRSRVPWLLKMTAMEDQVF